MMLPVALALVRNAGLDPKKQLICQQSCYFPLHTAAPLVQLELPQEEVGMSL